MIRSCARLPITLTARRTAHLMRRHNVLRREVLIMSKMLFALSFLQEVTGNVHAILGEVNIFGKIQHHIAALFPLN